MEKVIWEKYKQEKDSKHKEELKQEIILKYIHLVKIISGRLYNYYASNIEYEDLVSYGIIGLIDAIDKFDPSKNIKFETYSGIRIRGAIIDQIRSLDWVPRSIRQKSKLFKDAYFELESKLGREPSIQEIANKLQKSSKEVEKILEETNIYNVVSLEEEITENYRLQIRDKEDNDPESLLLKNDLIDKLKLQIDSLSEKEKIVISLYYYKELTYKEIGKILDVSESRISQIHSKAIVKLRKLLDD